jgi:hypothetical protein
MQTSTAKLSGLSLVGAGRRRQEVRLCMPTAVWFLPGLEATGFSRGAIFRKQSVSLGYELSDSRQ